MISLLRSRGQRTYGRRSAQRRGDAFSILGSADKTAAIAAYEIAFGSPEAGWRCSPARAARLQILCKQQGKQEAVPVDAADRRDNLG